MSIKVDNNANIANLCICEKLKYNINSWILVNSMRKIIFSRFLSLFLPLTEIHHRRRSKHSKSPLNFFAHYPSPLRMGAITEIFLTIVGDSFEGGLRHHNYQPPRRVSEVSVSFPHPSVKVIFAERPFCMKMLQSSCSESAILLSQLKNIDYMGRNIADSYHRFYGPSVLWVFEDHPRSCFHY